VSSSRKGRPPFTWICPEFLHDEELRALPADEYRRLFFAAFDGEKNVFSKYVKRQWKCPGLDTGIEIGRPPDGVV
jgi:hypothetical protein